MGSRYVKTLILNGVAVGEYLGSSDTEEDLQEARQALKNKGLCKPPTLIDAMRGQATAFAVAANLAYERMQQRGPGNPPLTFVPFVVNSAFAVELYIKTLLRAINIQPPKRGHGLVALHALLPAVEQAHLQALCVEHTPAFDPGTDETLEARLVPINEAFVQWRYAYEYERAGMVRPRSLILVMKACHEACRAITGDSA